MLGGQLGDGGGLEELRGRGPGSGMQCDDSGLTQRQRAGLVEHDRVHASEHLDVDASLHDGSLPRRTSNRSQDRERGPGCDPACAGYDDDRNRRACIPREDERENGGAQRKVDEVAREAVRRLLDRRSRFLGVLDDLDDLGERRVATDASRAHVERP
jgi:hypothetical protein